MKNEKGKGKNDNVKCKKMAKKIGDKGKNCIFALIISIINS